MSISDFGLSVSLRDRALAASKNAIIITDPTRDDNPIIYINPSFERMTGYSAEEVLGRNCRFLRGDDPDQPGMGALREALRDGKPHTCVLRNYRKNGEMFWNEVSISPVHDEDSQLTHFIGVCTDVTDRVHAESELLKATQLLYTVIEYLPGMVFLKDAKELRYEIINKAAQEFVGLEKTDFLGKSDFEIFQREEAEFLALVDREVLATGIPMTREEKITTRQDKTMIVVSKKVPILDESGNPSHVLGIAEDVTERRLAEVALREAYQNMEREVDERTRELREANKALSQEIVERRQAQEDLQKTQNYLRNIINHLPVVLFSINRDGCFTLSEGKGLSVLGLQPGEVNGVSAFEIYKDNPDLLEHLRRALQGEQFIAFDRIGALVFETLWAPLYEQGEFTGATGVAVDVTAKFQAEGALRRSESRLRQLVASNMIGVVFGDFEGRINEPNGAFLEMLGYSPEEWRATNPDWFALTPPHFWERDRESELELRRFGVVRPYEKRLIRKDGSLVDVLVGAARIESLIGPEYVGFAVDISPQKKAEAALREIQNELEQTVEERTRELRKANERLQAVARMRHNFVSTLTHDLRTPLIAQQRVLKTLLEESGIQGDERLRALIQGFLQNNAGLLHMVTNLLETYELEEGRVKVLPEPVTLYGLVEACHRELGELADSKGILLQNRIPSDFPSIQADFLLIKRLLQNLIGNALGHVSDGAVICLNAEESDGFVSVSVSDNGPGIPEEIRPHLFTRYFSESGSRRKIGTGLGLYICKMIIELHGGTITVKSLPGTGTTITFTLPKKGVSP